MGGVVVLDNTNLDNGVMPPFSPDEYERTRTRITIIARSNAAPQDSSSKPLLRNAESAILQLPFIAIAGLPFTNFE